jgi:hypothetical protein
VRYRTDREIGPAESHRVRATARRNGPNREAPIFTTKDEGATSWRSGTDDLDPAYGMILCAAIGLALWIPLLLALA